MPKYLAVIVAAWLILALVDQGWTLIVAISAAWLAGLAARWLARWIGTRLGR